MYEFLGVHYIRWSRYNTGKCKYRKLGFLSPDKRSSPWSRGRKPGRIALMAGSLGLGWGLDGAGRWGRGVREMMVGSTQWVKAGVWVRPKKGLRA